jgi:hypothetical protein
MMSSCGGECGRVGSELAPIAPQGPEHVYEAAGQGQQGLAVD